MPKSSSSPSPTITSMNPNIKPPPPPPASAALLSYPIDAHENPIYHLHPHSLLLTDDDDDDSAPAANPNSASFSSLLYDDEEDDEDDEDKKPGGTSADRSSASLRDDSRPAAAAPRPYVDPTPHISSQFYTFNEESHALMVRCILEGRLATPDEIRAATPRTVLRSWRSVWKDRNEDTAYLTAWKRIQDKLSAHLHDGDGAAALHFKSNPNQRVSHIGQWHDIVAAAHADADLRHLGLKETLDRIKQGWTVGAKFYGIPESFIRVCLSTCPVCTSASGGVGSEGILPAGGRPKRRRFEYTESFDVPAKDVQWRLQQLAAKHKVVLCIRQKYIRYKPFMAEVKDYACHRAGEPTSVANSSKKVRVLKREPYASKRCGCGFRIRAIVPIANYNEKDKSFVYKEEGIAVFKLYAVHSGHEPGPLDGNARIIHRLVGHKAGFDQDMEVYGVTEDLEPDTYFSILGKDEINDHQFAVLQQVQELRTEIGLLEGKISKMPQGHLDSLSQELSDILNRLKHFNGSHQPEGRLQVTTGEATHVGEGCNNQLNRDDRIFVKDVEILEEDNVFDRSLECIVHWNSLSENCQEGKLLMRESCKSDKWLMKEDCGDFDERSILNCGEDEEEEESKLIKPIQHEGVIVTNSSLVPMQVDGFYSDTPKWFDSPCGMDPGGGLDDSGLRHGI